MNVVDALFVTLGIDAKDFEKGNKDVDAKLKKLREEANKTAKNMEASGKRAAEMFSSIKVELLGLLAAFGAATGIKDFIFGSIASGAALGRLSANLHMSTQRLDAWRTAAEGVGETADGVAQSLQNIAAGLAKGITGDPSYFQGVAKFGVNLSADMTPEQAALLIAQKMREYDASGPQGRQYALLLAQAAGIGGMAQTELLPNLKQLLDQYTAASGQTPELIKQQMDLQRKVSELKERLRTVSEKVFVKLGPELEKIGTAIENVDWDKVSRNLQTWFDDAGKLITALGGVKGILIDIAAIKVFGWAASLGGTIIKLRAMTAALIAARAAAAGAAVPGVGVVPPGGATGFLGMFGSVVRTLGRGLALGFGLQQDEMLDWKTRLGSMDGATAKRYTAWLASHHMQASREAFEMFKADSTRTATAPHKQSPGRADDNIALFGGKYSGNTPAAFLSSLERQYGLPSGVLKSVLQAESHGNDPNYQVSQKGALGPFQFEPATAADYGLNGSTVFDFNKSADAAAHYLHDLLAMFHGDLSEALAAYNWGQGNVQKYGTGHLPAETQAYLRKVIGGMSIGAAATAASQAPMASSNSTITTQTHIGQITVHTKATDAKGIAGDMRQAIADNDLVSQADTGLN